MTKTSKKNQEEEKEINEKIRAEKPKKFVVAKGTAVTTKVGILEEGDVMAPEYLSGGQQAFNQLLEMKAVVGE